MYDGVLYLLTRSALELDIRNLLINGFSLLLGLFNYLLLLVFAFLGTLSPFSSFLSGFLGCLFGSDLILLLLLLHLLFLLLLHGLLELLRVLLHLTFK